MPGAAKGCPKRDPGAGLTNESDGLKSQKGLSGLQVGLALLQVFFYSASVLLQLERERTQGHGACTPSPGSPPASWGQGGQRGLQKSPLGLCAGRKGARMRLQAAGSGRARLPSWGKPSWVLTKHSPILHVCSVWAKRLSSLRRRNSAATARASPEACGAAEVGR